MKNLVYLLGLFLLPSCSTEPEPIKYGKDACQYCEMTIVDKSFSAQAVSTKGKQFKYDAVECMINHNLQTETEMAIWQVADYSHPGEMMPVDSAVFIINDSINSPMGANLAAIDHNSPRIHRKSADVFSWIDLVNLFREKDSLSANN